MARVGDPLTDRAAVLAALKDAEDRAAGFRTSLAKIEEEVAVLHLELRRRWAADYGVGDIPSARADDGASGVAREKGKRSGGGGGVGSAGCEASVVGRGVDERGGGDGGGGDGSAGGTRRVKRERSVTGWPDSWVRMKEKPSHGDGAPAGACKGC